MIRVLISKTAVVQRLALTLIILAIFWDGLWAGQPRADQLIYLHQVSGMQDFWEILKTVPSFNRTHSGDEILYRPVLYLLLGICYALFGDNYALWQITSLTIHISTVLILHAILWRAPLLRGTLWPFALAMLFGSSEMGAEMVLWNHINGYLLFAFLAVLQLWCLLEFLSNGRRRFAALSIGLCLITEFTYELGMVLAFLNACFLFFIGWQPRFRMSQRVPVSSAPPAFCFKLAGTFIAISICYPLVSLLDFYNKFGGLERVGTHFTDVNIIKTIQHLMTLVGHWLYSLLMPTIANVSAGSRTVFYGYQYGLNIIQILNYLAILAIAFPLIKLALKLRRKDWIRMGIPFLMGIGFLVAYSLVIVVGRVFPRPDGLLRAVFNNVYYSYFAQLTFLITIAISLIALGKPDQRIFTENKTHWITPPHFLLAGLLGLATLNATETTKLSSNHRQLNGPIQETLSALKIWHDESGSKNGEYFTIASNCQNDLLSWFGGGYIRRETGWNRPDLAGKFTVADALYPETSYNLNKMKADELDAQVTEIVCRPREPLTPEDILGSWAIHGQPTQIKREGSHFLLINERGKLSKAKTVDGYIVALDWNIDGRLSDSKRMIIWSNHTLWTR